MKHNEPTIRLFWRKLALAILAGQAAESAHEHPQNEKRLVSLLHHYDTQKEE